MQIYNFIHYPKLITIHSHSSKKDPNSPCNTIIYLLLYPSDRFVFQNPIVAPATPPAINSADGKFHSPGQRPFHIVHPLARSKSEFHESIFSFYRGYNSDNDCAQRNIDKTSDCSILKFRTIIIQLTENFLYHILRLFSFQ